MNTTSLTKHHTAFTNAISEVHASETFN